MKEKILTLAIDVGNSLIKWAIFENSLLLSRLQTTTYAQQTSDEYWLIYKNWQPLELKIVPQRIIISSVVPSITSQLQHMCRLFFSLEPFIVTTHIKTGLQLNKLGEAQLGSDLLTNAAAAYHALAQNCLVVVFGTALAFITLCKDGQIDGVAITAGMNTTLQALVRNTALLSQISLEKQPHYTFGHNTHQALQGGILGATRGAIEYFSHEAKKRVGEDSVVIATGFHGQLFEQFSHLIDIYDADLTMKGLLFFAEMNSEFFNNSFKD